MPKNLPIEVVKLFLGADSLSTYPLGNGHINSTFLVDSRENKIVIQEINTQVFKDPTAVMSNIQKVSNHLSGTDYDLELLSPLPSANDKLLEEYDSRFYRAFPYFEGSKVIEKINSVDEAHQAAHAFGKFTKCLMTMDPNSLEYTIPGFHNFSARLEHLDRSISGADPERLSKVREELEKVNELRHLVSDLDSIGVPNRVLHSDPKFNNILFDENGSPLCVIDLDTLMPGPLFYDLSDMIRSYCNTADEDESELERVTSDPEILKAVLFGYLDQVKANLTEEEWTSIEAGFTIATYIQVVRFLSDFLNNDIYYQIKYPEHNLIRTRNQIRLLDRLLEQRDLVGTVIADIRSK